jgi:hypothetical protein
MVVVRVARHYRDDTSRKRLGKLGGRFTTAV